MTGRGSGDIDPADHYRSGDRDRRELDEMGAAGAVRVEYRGAHCAPLAGAKTVPVGKNKRRRCTPALALIRTTLDHSVANMSGPIIPEVRRRRRRRGLVEHATSANSLELPSTAFADVDQALAETAKRMEAWAARVHTPRAAWNELKLIFNQKRALWFGMVCKAFDERCTLEPESSAWARALAYNAWSATGRFWMEYAPLPHVPVYRLLYESLRAAGAPLPVDYDNACRARLRIEGRVRAALDPRSKMSDGWRRHWLQNYAPIAAAESQLGSPAQQRRRLVAARATAVKRDKKSVGV